MSLRRLSIALSQYSVAGLLSTLAGLVSFPFFTRIFSVSDYGTISLVSTTLAGVVAIGKCGLQHSILRFHRPDPPGTTSNDSARVVSTGVLGMASLGTVAAAGWLAVVAAIPPTALGDRRLRPLLALATILVLVQVVDSALVNLLRAEQRSGTVSGYLVAKKYLGLGSAAAGLLVLARELDVYYGAQVISETLALCALAVFAFRARGALPRPSLGAFSPPLLIDMLRYGLPMMIGWELSGIILSLGDRYLVHAFLGSERLGNYAAAYNLCQHIEAVLLTPWGMAITPIYLRLWSQRDETNTRRFVDGALRYYILAGVPVVAGLSAIGPDLLASLASEKHRDGSVAIPFVVAGLLASGAVPITGAGVFIQKRTWVAARYVLLSAILNLALNLILIPRFGIVGAAFATFASYVVLMLCMTIAARRHLRVTVPWGLIIRSMTAAMAMYVAVTPIRTHAMLFTIATKIGLGILVYGSLMLAIDGHAKEALRTVVQRAKS